MDQQIPKLAEGFAKKLPEGEIEHRYTNPDLHRRIDDRNPRDVEEILTDTNLLLLTDWREPFQSVERFLLVLYDTDGTAFPQQSKVGILDGHHSYRVVEAIIHDEESTTSEIP
jgi:hypothetical protein